MQCSTCTTQAKQQSNNFWSNSNSNIDPHLCDSNHMARFFAAQPTQCIPRCRTCEQLLIATYGSTGADTRLCQMLEGAIGNCPRDERICRLRRNPLTSNAHRLAGLERKTTRWNYNRRKWLVCSEYSQNTMQQQVTYMQGPFIKDVTHHREGGSDIL